MIHGGGPHIKRYFDICTVCNSHHLTICQQICMLIMSQFIMIEHHIPCGGRPCQEIIQIAWQSLHPGISNGTPSVIINGDLLDLLVVIS